MEIIIAGLLFIIVLQLKEVINRLPKRDIMKEALDRDRERSEREDKGNGETF